ncbi:hypothetical protein [Limosilactobacillus pontis]
MELETQLPVPDREMRRAIEENFQKIQGEINKLEKQIENYNAGGGM